MSDTIKRLREGRLYYCDDPEFINGLDDRLEILYELNATMPREKEKKQRLYKKYFGHVGKDLYIELPFRASWGYNIYWGDDCYANFNLTVVDDVEVRIGDNVLFAPNVTVTTTGHAIEPELRRRSAQFSLPIVIENNVWIGANSVILPGVHIGENSVIGAGSVVSRDIPANVVAVGNPCRVMREIGERDRRYYFRDMEVDLDLD